MTNWNWNGYGFKAMNTRVYTWIYSNIPNSAAVLLDIQASFDSTEKRLSRFLAESELSQLNRNTDFEFQASPTLFSVMQTAIWAATATGGLFDPTILKNLEKVGYNRSFENVARAARSARNQAHSESVASVAPNMGQFEQIQLRRSSNTIYKSPDIKIDLGGIGKGWTVDRAADRLVGAGPFLVNAGGDLYAYGAPPDASTWMIDIPHPEDSNRLITTLHVRDCAVATSSITRRRWSQGGKVQHHLIDPRTGYPAETDLLSVTVIAQRAAIAEVFAKAALILGSRDGVPYLEAVPNIEALFITKDNRVLGTSNVSQYTNQLLLSRI